MRIRDEKVLADRGYNYIGTVGQGAYSQVNLYYATHMSKQVAVKIIDKSIAPRDFVNNFLPREVDILQKVRHNNIVDIYEILATNDGRIFIIMEYAAHGDLLRHIQRNGAMDERRAKNIFGQLCKAVAYLHESNIVHRDLKCENLLLTNIHFNNPQNTHNTSDIELTMHGMSAPDTQQSAIDNVTGIPLRGSFNMYETKLVLTDFGFSRLINQEGQSTKSRTFCGSAAYAAPEVIKGESYIPEHHDIWSLGVILYIIVCGTMPYDDSNVRAMLKEQLSRRVRFPPEAAHTLTPDCKNLIHRLIEPNVRKRLSIYEIMKHPWLASESEHDVFQTTTTNTVRRSLDSHT